MILYICRVLYTVYIMPYNIRYITYEVNTFNDTLNFNEILETSIFVLTVCRIEFQIAFEWNQIRSIKSFHSKPKLIFSKQESAHFTTIFSSRLVTLTCYALKSGQNVLMRGFMRTDILVLFERVTLWDYSCSYWSKVAV